LADNPGVWMVHCHIEHHMANGMMTTIWYAGHEPTGPAADAASAEATMAADQGHQHHNMPIPESPEPTATAATSPASGDRFEVVMADDRFVPEDATIPAGTTVVWVNKGIHWHSVANLDLRFTSGKIFPGESFSYTFETPGTYKIYCQHHSMAGMNGTITVT
jgi:plastocyanin